MKWWTNTSIENFKKKVECLVEQYGNYSMFGKKVRNSQNSLIYRSFFTKEGQKNVDIRIIILVLMFCTEVLKLHEPQFWNNIEYFNTELFGK